MSDNAFDLARIWNQGDAIAHGVALLLLAMSLISWTIILVKLWQLNRLRRLAGTARQFWHATSFEQGAAALGASGRDNPFHELLSRGSEAVAHHGDNRDELHGVLSLADWLSSTLRQTMDEAAYRQQSGLSLLASVGSTAPFIGLFGTVWGIFHALVAIGASGQAGLDKVAGPVGESLVMTALGLAVAIPAVLGYNALVRGNKGQAAQLKRFAHDLHSYLLSGGRLRAAPVSAKEA